MPLCKHYFSIIGLGQNLTLETFQPYWQFFDKPNIFEPNNRFSHKFESSLEGWRAKGNLSDIPGQNILEPYNYLLQNRSETSKTNLHI